MLTARRVLALAMAVGLAGGTALASAPAAAAAAAGAAYSVPSDSWSLFQSDINAAGGLATGRGVTVAILSSGVDTSAAGLAGRSSEGPDYVSRPPRDPGEERLGTLEAGLVVGVPGVVQGIAPGARILGVRVELDSHEPGAAAFLRNDYGDNSQNTGQLILAKAIMYAVDHGAKVIDVDTEVWSGDGLSTQFMGAVAAAIRRNVVIVAPESNSGSGPGSYQAPAGLPGVIGVSSVMLPGGTLPSVTGTKTSGNQSARNNSVVISGPGDWVQASPADWGTYGTSTAAPYVAGTVALIKQLYPDMSPSLIERALAMSARDKPKGGYSTTVGFGVLNPYQAVLDAGTLAKVTVTAASGAGVIAAGTHFGSGPLPGVIDALPPAGSAVSRYRAAIGAGVLLLVIAVVLAVASAVRSRRRRPA